MSIITEYPFCSVLVNSCQTCHLCPNGCDRWGESCHGSKREKKKILVSLNSSEKVQILTMCFKFTCFREVILLNIICLKVGVCRKQLFNGTSPETSDDPPTPKADWRDKCATILRKKYIFKLMSFLICPLTNGESIHYIENTHYVEVCINLKKCEADVVMPQFMKIWASRST